MLKDLELYIRKEEIDGHDVITAGILEKLVERLTTEKAVGSFIQRICNLEGKDLTFSF